MSSRSAAVLLLVFTCALGAAWTAQAATITVNGTGDTVALDGSVTLREAIASFNGAANVNADVAPVGSYGSGDTIAFNIPGAGPHTILVGATPLPTLARPMIIDGYTQPGSFENTLAVGDNAVINIVLQGTTSGVHGLTVGPGGSGSVITGLVLQHHFFAVQIAGSNVTVAGNFIGTDRGATLSDATTTNAVGINIGNGNIGNNLIGGATPAERNVISGNTGGIIMNSQLPNTVRGNYIGVSGTGTAAIPNGTVGIAIGTLGAASIGGATIGGVTAIPGQGAGNVISGNGSRGIEIQTGSSTTTVIGPSTIQGNILGLDANGVNAIPNTGANVYLFDANLPNDGIPRLGPVTISGNVLSSGGHGVFALAAGTILRGNSIGTDITGTVARPNTFGIEITSTGLAFVSSATIGGTGAGEGNLISGNASDAVRLFLATATLQGNRIGVSSSGSPLGNGGSGIFVDSGLATIGGTAAGAGNTIANNGDTGVQVRIGFSNVRNASEATILGNSITGNALLGINNSAPDVVTANDAGDGDSGPNDLQNFPVITAASLSGGNVTVSGTLNSTAGATFRVELFSSQACDALGFGEGATFLGAVDVTTDGSGNGSFGPAVLAIPAGQPVITATATNPAGHTSEFSSCVTAAGGPPPLPTLSIDSVSNNEGNVGNTPFTFTVTLSAASATPVTVSYATADGSATAAGADYLPASGVLTFAPGGPLSQTITVNAVGDLAVETNETFTVTLSAPSGATLATTQGTGTLVNDDSAAPPAEEIPTLSEWGILLLAGALALLALARMGR
ncbi:MAG TPA: IPTL-CTERM sorting domain-containing protein [Thermoanaerobaculia bacterium]|nr:IPTL-CTERM sorting domain-containing protein [Thermoanaerobaculia bacterium]